MERKEKDIDKKTQNTIGNGKYTLQKKIGQGSFGQVYLAANTDEPNQQLAVKAESIASRFP